MISRLKNSIHSQISLAKFPLAIIFLLLLVLILTKECVSPYTAEIEEEVDLITIEGSLIAGDSIQTVVISKTTNLILSQFVGVEDCKVEVIDDQDNSFTYNEKAEGTYILHIPDADLVFNRKYKLRVTTREGDVYESGYETLNAGTDVDSVYYEIEDKIDFLTGESKRGIQFYVDLKASDSISRYFKWVLTETYEYTSSAPVTFYYEDQSLDPEYMNNPMQFFRCWRTSRVPGLYLSSTENLTHNEKKRIPLHYVSAATDQLKIKYSLFLEQYALDESAYRYWQNNKIATQESGGLYMQQPGRPITNISNQNDSTEQVLGYFWVAQRSKQRIFVPKNPDLQVTGNNCQLVEFSVAEHGEGPFPIYIWVDPISGQMLTSYKQCFICTLRGGTTEPPDFWE